MSVDPISNQPIQPSQGPNPQEQLLTEMNSLGHQIRDV